MTPTSVEDLPTLLQQLRAPLHRYCARMVGSAFEGEDIVQEALAKAVESFAAAGTVERLDRWLFRIAHNTAIDALRRRKRLAEIELSDEQIENAESGAAAEQLVTASTSLRALVQLPIIQRAAVILIDVLEHSLNETAELLDVSVAAVKSALHRGRMRLQSIRAEDAVAELSRAEIERLGTYVEQFNAREFDLLRDLLAEDVRLDLVNRLRLTGRKDVGVYFSRYDESRDWRVTLGLAEGRPAVLVSHPDDAQGRVSYVILLRWEAGRIVEIQDFRHARYIVDTLAVEKL